MLYPASSLHLGLGECSAGINCLLRKFVWHCELLQRTRLWGQMVSLLSSSASTGLLCAGRSLRPFHLSSTQEAFRGSGKGCGSILSPRGWMLLTRATSGQSVFARPFTKCVKVLVGCLKPILPRLISPEQDVFVDGCRITDNMLLAQEFMHDLHRTPTTRA